MENNNNIEKTKKTFTMKFLILCGTVLFALAIINLMYYFFVKKNDIYINMSTDKQVNYIEVNNENTVILTQKYVSDLNYNMRYDMNLFRVFKFGSTDYYRYLEDESIIVSVEKSNKPSQCINNNESDRSDCYVFVDEYTEIYYLTNNNNIYKVTVKNVYNSGNEKLINEVKFMLNSFEFVSEI